MLRDFRLAVRTLARTPAFTLTTIAVLALGIGANTAIFGLVNQVLLRPPGIANPERVVSIRAKYDKLNLASIPVSAPDFRDVQQGTRVFECAAILNESDFNYTGGEVPERLQGAAVSWRWFDVFGATAHLGRTFRAEEDQPKANTVAVLSYASWRRLFGGDPSVVGRTFPLNGTPYRIVGVMKPDFRWPSQVDVWVPLGLPAAAFSDDNRFNEGLTAVARVRPGVSFAQADAFVRLAADRVKNSRGEDGTYARDSRWGMFVVPMTDFLAADRKMPLLVLVAAVGFVLLIACANVAGLMVARAASRAHEIAVRAALGASVWRQMRQMLGESVVLSSAGAALGLLLAYGGTQLLLLAAPENATIGLAVVLDVPVLLFTLVAGAVSAVLAAAAPAWQAARLEPYDHIRTGGRSAIGGRARQRLRAGLVISQTALALVLLVGAGLLLRSLARLEQVNPGFDPRGVTTARLSLPPAQYGAQAKQIAFFRALTEHLAGMPGIVAAGAGGPLPFSGDGASASFTIEGRTLGPGDPGPHGNVRFVTPGYRAALDIPLKNGRFLTDQDRPDTEAVVVVDENLARQYWPGENPVGKRLRNGSNAPWATIVGVVGHVKHSDLAADGDKGTYYYSLLQHSVPFGSLVVKAADRSSAPAAIRAAVHAIDPALPVHSITSMADQVSASLAPRRFAMRLLAFFAAVALFMAALGLYAVISYAVAQRTAEIGVRLALGAQRGQVLRLIVSQGMSLAVVGVLVGVVASLASSRLLTSQLYGVDPFDPSTFAVMIAGLLGAAFLASYIPARRATHVDPLVALRTE
jgi:predicted permease